MEITNIRELLPEGSYALIAEKIKKSEGTVRQFFAKNVQVRISQDTEKAILDEAIKIIEVQKDKAVELLKELAKAA